MRAYVLSVACSVALFSGQLIIRSCGSGKNLTQPEKLNFLRHIHSDLVSKLKHGASLAGNAPDRIVDRLLSIPNGNSEMAARKAEIDVWRIEQRSGGSVASGEEPQTTYLEALQWSEEQMVAAGIANVTVEVDSEPDKCDVYYRKVTSRNERLFMGRTKTSRPMEPRYYEFQCACRNDGSGDKWEPVDCTVPVSFKFSCSEK